MQVLDVVGAYRDEGLPEAVFAAAVPMNYSKKVQALLDEVLADDDAAVRLFSCLRRRWAWLARRVCTVDVRVHGSAMHALLQLVCVGCSAR